MIPRLSQKERKRRNVVKKEKTKGYFVASLVGIVLPPVFSFPVRLFWHLPEPDPQHDTLPQNGAGVRGN